MFRNAVIYLFISFLVACGGDHEMTSELGTGSLVVAPDEVALLTLLKGAIRNTGDVSYYDSSLTTGTDVQFDTASATAEASSTTSVSSTNLQVSGVDEADLIKNDANHLFIAASATTDYYYPIGVMETVSSTSIASDTSYPEPVATANKIRILKMLSNPAATEVVA